MHMWAKTERRWRKKAKRGVSPIIATILLVAITVVLAAVLYILISGLTKGPGNTPLGTALAMSPATEQQAGTHFWYNFSIESASGGLTLSDLSFQVLTSTGGIVTLLLPAATVIGLTGNTLATYTWATAVWASGGSTTASNQQQFSLTTTSNLESQGDQLNVLGGGTFSGSIPVNIP
jgi:flagellin-like protein